MGADSDLEAGTGTLEITPGAGAAAAGADGED